MMTDIEYVREQMDLYENLRIYGTITREEELDYTRELRLQLQENVTGKGDNA